MFEDGGQPPNSSLRVPPSYFARRWSKCRRTAGQSPSVIEYCAVSVTSPVRMIRSLRMRPSNTAPSRSIARRDGWLNQVARKHTRRQPHYSNAWASISSFASVFVPVRWADAACHV